MISRRDINKDLIGAFAGLVISGAYYLGALKIPRSSLIGKGVGADALPIGLAACLAILSTILLARAIWFYRKLPARQAPTVEEREKQAKDRYRHKRAAGMLAIGIGYLLALDLIGYIPSIFLLLLITALYSGRDFSARTVGFAALLTTAFYILFDFVLHIPMPMGIWPDIWAALTG